MTEAAIALAAGAARLRSRARGAEARRWSVGGVELLWPGDPAIWAEISPILYPVVGWTRDGARVGGRHYPLGCTASPRGEDFAVETAGGDFRPADASATTRTRARSIRSRSTLAVEYRLAGDGARDHARGRQSRRRAGALRLRPPSRLPLAVRRGRRAPGASCGSRRTEPADVPAIAPGGLIGQSEARDPAQRPRRCR